MVQNFFGKIELIKNKPMTLKPAAGMLKTAFQAASQKCSGMYG
jgi:hypothetical protein